VDWSVGLGWPHDRDTPIRESSPPAFRKRQVAPLRAVPPSDGHQGGGPAPKATRVVGGGKRIYAAYKGKEYKAVVYNSGRIKFNGQFYDSPSAAGKAAPEREVNGWTLWRVRKDGEPVKLSELR